MKTGENNTEHVNTDKSTQNKTPLPGLGKLKWKMDKTELENEVKNYDTQGFFNSSRGAAICFILLDIIASLIFTHNIDSWINAMILLVLVFFVYKGNRAALITFMILLPLNGVFSIINDFIHSIQNYSSTQSSNVAIHTIITISICSFLVNMLWQAYQVERKRKKGIKFSKGEIAWMILGVIFLSLCFLDGFYSIKQGIKTIIGVQQPLDEAIITANLTIGDSYGGGKVAYILQYGDPGYNTSGIQHGLIAAAADNSTGIYWHATNDATTGALGTALGTGLANTNAIVAVYGTEVNAAKICKNYTGSGFTDWYLPSKDELNKLYLNRVVVGCFAAYGYWSSSESNATYACNQYFYIGNQNYFHKTDAYYVRCVRGF